MHSVLSIAGRRAGLAVRISILAMVAGACGGPERTGDPHLSHQLREAKIFIEFPVYWDGARLGRLPLTGVDLAPEHYRIAYTFLYGTCADSGSEGGCAPPLEIQTTDLCNRLPRDLGLSHRLGSRLRGAVTSPAEGGADNGASISLYVKGATITIYGDRPTRVRAAVAALQGVNSLAPVRPGQPLPAATMRQIAGNGC